MNKEKDPLNFKEIGSRIRAEREKLNLTREKFAEIIGLSSFYIGQIERGDRKMSVDTLIKIADSLHVSVDYLLKGHILYTNNTHLNKEFSVSESNNENYIKEIDDEIRDLLSRCSEKEISLIKDMIRLILPYLGN
ncbi:helix-turn-helix domain-containing protein [Tissierella sp. MSJ-40]|uniref:Helix-turn-helix domain-containing protein n=1 Tax=Tissierella simiarum TaxID=2841534 RepID=A0ABS6E2P7_9FIRM|nr:helix-turn-helix domain-containing protein [Tissierella simiarum]MBU5437177.1 helix-turn-helix domain-containing protein [Tissierella simiarum]